MSSSSDPDLIKVTELFLVPSSFLVAALGAANTNPHRAAVSLLGLVISGLWWVCSREALAGRHSSGPDHGVSTRSRRVRILSWLPVCFVAGWALSLVIHVVLWSQPLGH
jgi:hypothetical protein